MRQGAQPDVDGESPGIQNGILNEILDQFSSERAKDDLKTYVKLLEKWQATHNLISAPTLNQVWSRHVLDSAQLIKAAPDACRWVDLGSGAGFPGMVIAILIADNPHTRVALVESNNKKCAFLRAVARSTNAPVDVVQDRIENFAKTRHDPVDVVTARALAPFADLCRLASPIMAPESVMVLLKGQDFVYEEEEASKYWDYDLVIANSMTDPRGRVVTVRNLKGKS